MRKIYMTLLFAALCTFAQAQTYNVLLVVDMSNEAAVDDTICVAGEFQDADASNMQADWTAGVHNLEDAEGDLVYSLLIQVPAGDYQYKYINGGTWGNNEGAGIDANCGADDGFGNFNRLMTISSDTTIAYVYDACTLASIPTNTTKIETAASFDIAPNPLTDVTRITIDNPENETLNVIITNVMGQVVRQENVVNNTVEVSRTNFEAGMYFVTVMNEKGAKVTKKLSVQ